MECSHKDAAAAFTARACSKRRKSPLERGGSEADGVCYTANPKKQKIKRSVLKLRCIAGVTHPALKGTPLKRGIMSI